MIHEQNSAVSYLTSYPDHQNIWYGFKLLGWLIALNLQHLHTLVSQTFVVQVLSNNVSKSGVQTILWSTCPSNDISPTLSFTRRQATSWNNQQCTIVYSKYQSTNRLLFPQEYFSLIVFYLTESHLNIFGHVLEPTSTEQL